MGRVSALYTFILAMHWLCPFFDMDATIGPFQKQYIKKKTDFNRDEIFQMNSRGNPFWPHKKWRNFRKV